MTLPLIKHSAASLPPRLLPPVTSPQAPPRPLLQRRRSFDAARRRLRQFADYIRETAAEAFEAVFPGNEIVIGDPCPICSSTTLPLPDAIHAAGEACPRAETAVCDVCGPVELDAFRHCPASGRHGGRRHHLTNIQRKAARV
jgi:hypothetical protein